MRAAQIFRGRPAATAELQRLAALGDVLDPPLSLTPMRPQGWSMTISSPNRRPPFLAARRRPSPTPAPGGQRPRQAVPNRVSDARQYRGDPPSISRYQGGEPACRHPLRPGAALQQGASNLDSLTSRILDPGGIYAAHFTQCCPYRCAIEVRQPNGARSTSRSRYRLNVEGPLRYPTGTQGRFQVMKACENMRRSLRLVRASPVGETTAAVAIRKYKVG